VDSETGGQFYRGDIRIRLRKENYEQITSLRDPRHRRVKENSSTLEELYRGINYPNGVTGTWGALGSCPRFRKGSMRFQPRPTGCWPGLLTSIVANREVAAVTVRGLAASDARSIRPRPHLSLNSRSVYRARRLLPRGLFLVARQWLSQLSAGPTPAIMEKNQPSGQTR